MSDLPPELVTRLRQVCRFAELLAETAASLEELLPPEEPRNGRPGRPRAAATAKQEREILRLRHTNGHLGLREIGRRVGVSWRVVQRVLDDHEAASQNPLVPSQNPGRGEGASGTSERRLEGGETTKATGETCGDATR